MPPYLQLTLLNVPPALDATASLPRPQVPTLLPMRARKLSTSRVVEALAVLPVSVCATFHFYLCWPDFCLSAGFTSSYLRCFGAFTRACAEGQCRMRIMDCSNQWLACGAARHPEPPVLPAECARHQRDGGGRNASLQEQVRHHRAIQAAAPRSQLATAWRRQRRRHAAHDRLMRSKLGQGRGDRQVGTPMPD